jgi:mRNA-degrading endonuclease RelE of RelBE toxin-antitoxin system
MTPPFIVRTTPRFERLLRRLTRGHPDLVDAYAEALMILGADPYNRSRRHHILKLEGIPQGEGQYRLRLRRWRFRYDIIGQEVVLHYCGLRREDTYR